LVGFGWLLGLLTLMMEAVRTSETSVDNHFTRQYIPEDNSEHHTRRRENLKSPIYTKCWLVGWLGGDNLLFRDFGPYVLICMNTYLVTAVEGF
jgi:hypothetical protein